MKVYYELRAFYTFHFQGAKLINYINKNKNKNEK